MATPGPHPLASRGPGIAAHRVWPHTGGRRVDMTGPPASRVVNNARGAPISAVWPSRPSRIGAAISRPSRSMKKSSWPSRRHRGCVPPASETSRVPPGPGNGCTKISNCPPDPSDWYASQRPSGRELAMAFIGCGAHDGERRGIARERDGQEIATRRRHHLAVEQNAISGRDVYGNLGGRATQEQRLAASTTRVLDIQVATCRRAPSSRRSASRQTTRSAGGQGLRQT